MWNGMWPSKGKQTTYRSDGTVVDEVREGTFDGDYLSTGTRTAYREDGTINFVEEGTFNINERSEWSLADGTHTQYDGVGGVVVVQKGTFDWDKLVKGTITRKDGTVDVVGQ